MRGFSLRKRIVVVLAAGPLLMLGCVGVAYSVTKIPRPSQISTAQATRFLYSDGTEMGRMGTNREIVPLSKISVAVQQAVIAAEDRGFYSESGISLRGIGRALLADVTGGAISQGGSTITQQYAKNAFLSQRRTFSRKLQEILIALKLSHTVSKATVLEDYLNTIYFGRGAYGVEAAARTYFGTTAARLTVAQGAVLAASIPAPSWYDPTLHPAQARDRWQYVLNGMVSQGWLSAAERNAITYPSVRPISTLAFPGPLQAVQAQVVRELAKHGISEAQLEAGGYTVLTTISRSAEQAATAVMSSVIPAPKGKHPPVAALVSVQPGTGAVQAYYGSRRPGGFDYASDGSGVQPGSSMKPYVLAAALEQGIPLTATYDASTPQTICGTQINNDAGDPPLGSTDLVTGLQYSVNTVYYRLACDVGPQHVADLAHAAGIPTRDPLEDSALHHPTAQIALGSGGYEVHVIDQAVGYATFAARGVAAAPYFVQQVTRGGHVVYAAHPRPHRAFPSSVAADVTVAMQKVVQAGTGTRAQLAGRPVAGKTGTTGNNANAWFIGFTPQLATAVWVGRQGGTPLRGVLGSSSGIYGGTIPAEIFHAFMGSVLRGQPALPFPPPSQVAAPTSSLNVSTAVPSTQPPTAPPSTMSASPQPSAPPAKSPQPHQTPAPARSPAPPPPSPSPPAPPPPSPTASPNGGT